MLRATGGVAVLHSNSDDLQDLTRVIATDELDYTLPEELIATRPADRRDEARLMVLKRSDPGFLQHRIIRDLPQLFSAEDFLVFNRSRVLPARIHGVRSGTGGRVQGLYLRHAEQRNTWVAMLRAGHLRPGASIDLFDPNGHPAGVVLTLIEKMVDEAGAWVVEVADSADPDAPSGLATLERVGLPPIPPYILNARRHRGQQEDQPDDQARYQTVFAEPGGASARSDSLATGSVGGFGSVAAPTAGLHFTPELLDRVQTTGARIGHVTLHIGSGTFKPIETTHIEEHPIHAEWCSIEPELLPTIRAATPRGRLFAIGTTSARTLESYAGWLEANTTPAPRWLQTRLLITPGYRWKLVDGMLTNLHLPRSSLLAMIASLLTREEDGPLEGVRRIRHAYEVAVKERYRFYSYGDAMLILP